VTAQHQHEIIPANMADEIHLWVDPVVQTLGQAQQHFIAFGVAIQIDDLDVQNDYLDSSLPVWFLLQVRWCLLVAAGLCLPVADSDPNK